MKKILSILAIVAVALSIGSCGLKADITDGYAATIAGMVSTQVIGSSIPATVTVDGTTATLKDYSIDVVTGTSAIVSGTVTDVTELAGYSWDLSMVIDGKTYTSKMSYEEYIGSALTSALTGGLF